ncbi:hypothetical protein A3F58_00325 [Candidatus Roizmanbacteria bacterium RIFCSPHIGHO2_12_FULL_37_9b]|nr:MAG: hypothetical protein A3F58_00325 [Candidatus Roizmanbacteria bacterium RIFCSPHIGHO2_12_FULL_37_9b]
MKKYKCPICFSTASVIKYGKQGRSLRFFCKRCKKHFSINPNFLNKKAVVSDHLDGLSFRKLAVKYGISKSFAWEICHEELKKLPDNNKFTFNYCNRFSSTFVFDGKYFNVADLETDMVLLWGIDYFRHDIPIFTIASSESYQAWARFFSFFRIISHHPTLLVCDDNVNLKMAAISRFPQVKIQTCYNHFKENIRRELHVRSDKTYREFMRRIEDIFAQKLNDEAMNQKLFALYRDYRDDPVTVKVLTNIEKYRPELLGYRGISHAPITSNLIESFNSHLEARLFSLRSFQTASYARLWLNGYVLKRRLTKFTDCEGFFRFLNGKTGVDMTKKDRIDIPILF